MPTVRVPAIVGVALALVALAFVLLSDGPGASAVTYTVTKTTDSADGSCNADCSLREAVIAANAAPGNTVSIPAGTYTLSLAGSDPDSNPNAAQGDIDIAKSMTIDGAGPGATIIDGAGIDRIFQTTGFSYAATIQDMTLRNGSAQSATNGGALLNGNSITLTLNNVVAESNTAASGGGMANAGIMTINNSTIKDNTATSAGGGLLNAPTTGTLTLNTSTINGNIVFTGSGGGISNRHTMTITNSTISGNNASASGGGIYNNIFSAGSFNLTITNATIANNAAGTGSGIHNDDPLSLKNSIITGNCSGAAGITSQGYNIADSSTCNLNGTGDKPGQNPNLGALANNGGPTQTHAISDSSPATNAGTNNGCPGTDQRGVARPQYSTCDMGAYEYDGGSPPPTPTPTPPPTPTPTPPPPTATPPPTPVPTATPTPPPSTPTNPPSTPTNPPATTPGTSPTPTPTPTLTPTPGPSGSATATPTSTPTPPATPTPSAPPGTATRTPTPAPTTPGPTQPAVMRIWGDVDCTNAVNSVDALKISRHVVGMSSGQIEPCPDISVAVQITGGSPHLWGDADCDDDVDAVDTLRLLRHVASLPVTQIEPCPDIGTQVSISG